MKLTIKIDGVHYQRYSASSSMYSALKDVKDILTSGQSAFVKKHGYTRYWVYVQKEK